MQLVKRQSENNFSSVYGIPTGGCCVALMLRDLLEVPIVASADEDSLIVDDLVDSGRTLRPYMEAGMMCDVLIRKPHSPFCDDVPERDGWVVFPWETHQPPAGDALARVLQASGVDAQDWEAEIALLAENQPHDPEHVLESLFSTDWLVASGLGRIKKDRG